MISEFPILRLGLFVGMLVLMFGIETFWPARSWFDRRSDRVKFSAGLAIVNNLFMRIFIAAPFIAFAGWVDSQGWGLSKLLGINGILEVLLTIVLFDFFDALKHKWFHRVYIMWRFHRVHHTDKSLDILTALRYHPGELLISAFIKAGWILIWGPSALAFTIFEIVLNFSSEFHHANIHLGKFDKYLNKVIVTPRYHAIHHTINREKGDQNFTTVFSFWDRLLGTHSCPETTAVDLERLNSLQDKHINLWNVLKSPIIDPNAKGAETKEGDSKSEKEYLNAIYLEACKDIKADRGLLIDVREPSERLKYGAIKGALNYPFKKFDQRVLDEICELSRGKELYIHCQAGVRAQKIIDRINKSGMKAKNLGGYYDCVENGLKELNA